MWTITIAAYRRPEYLAQVLESLKVALEYCPEFNPQHIILGVDPGGGGTQIPAPVKIAVDPIYWPEHLGVNEHPRRLLQYAFMELDSDFNLHLEDDTVLSPDALRLAMWYQKWGYEALTLSLHSHSRDHGGRNSVRVVKQFGAWGWACSRHVWTRWLSHYWNYKREFPIGWDWSISELMEEESLHSLTPVLSRVRNIGREKGTYQTPEGYDQDFAGQTWAGLEHMQNIEDFRL
jgi:hypothetical protein